MKKRFGLLVLVCALVLCSLTGCGKKSLLDPDHPVTLTMWHNYGGDMQQTMDYLIDQFNSTVGREEGVVINVTAISSSSELNKSLERIANGDPGAPQLPDIFTGYPRTAIGFQEKGMLVNFADYFTGEDQALYVEAFLEEGRLSDGGLYVFPLAKSTEILYLNQTLFDRFAAETGADEALLGTFEGIAELARMYYHWTDALTPDVPDDGKQFYAADSWYNAVETGVEQLGEHFFIDGQLNTLSESYKRIYETLRIPAVEGGFAIYDGYSSDLSKTGDLICSTGSSAGILFYGDTITHSDGSVEEVEYRILPYPVFEGGEKLALQRGGGLMVAKSEEKREYAACLFLRWLTQPEQNLQFISRTGYLPVTRQAFEQEMESHMENVDDPQIAKMLRAVLSMYEEYRFYTPPNDGRLEDLSDAFESEFKAEMKLNRSRHLAGE